MAVGVHHLKGDDGWLRCDHDATRFHAGTRTIRLALEPELSTEVVDLDPWGERWVGGVALGPRPDACDEAFRPWRVGDRIAGVEVAENGEWSGTDTFVGDLRALVDDGCGRMWGLVAGGTVAAAAGADGGVELEIPLPFPARWLAISSVGIYAADDTRLWFGRWGRPWQVVELELEPTATIVGVAASGAFASACVHDSGTTSLLRFEGSRLAQTSDIPVPEVRGLAMDPSGAMWLPIVSGPPPRRTRLAVFRWSPAGASRDESYEVGRFDGRGLVFVDGVTWGSTPTGWVRAYRISPKVLPRGRVETFALDSGRYGCVWHRVFLDVCLPEGTSFRVSARTADGIPEQAAGDLRPRPATGVDGPLEPPLGLGSRHPDDQEGWVDVGAMDLQPRFVDHPNPPRGELPSPDPLPRGIETSSGATHTLEGLLKNPPGRYLWLRIHLFGRATASPVLAGCRVHAPRPSMLAFLPAWWRSDPDAQRTEELLALFEAPLSRMEDRVDTLPALFDPLATAPEALDWLATFVGLTFEPQLPERVRRALLAEAAALYRRRGTVQAVQRVCTLIAEAPVRIVEGWQTRAATGGSLGDHAVMGQTLQLGGIREPASDGTDDAVRAWFASFAHRFEVIVHRPCVPWIQGLLDRAIEHHKPAHTAHRLCFADSLTIGQTTVGVTTRPEGRPGPDTAVVDEAVLGASTLHRSLPALPALPIPFVPEES